MGLFDKFFGSEKSGPDFEFELEPREGDYGQGLILHRLSDGVRMNWQSLSARSDGLQSVEIAGVSHHPDALQDSSFAPGQPLELVREPDNPHDPNAFSVWNADRTLQVGYLPKWFAAKLAKDYGTGPKVGCLSMWETRKGKKRVALRVLLVYEHAKVRGVSFK